MNLDRARAIIAHRAKRESRARAMLASLFAQQREALQDLGRLKAFFGTRRAGKSWALGILLFLVALAFPRCSCLYLGLTKATAMGIMNKDILEVINERFAIGAKWKASDFCWVLPNGSIIYMRGADANAYEIAKVVGQKYRLAILDEASKYRYIVRDMVYGSLLPAMGDDLGTIVLSGTPSNVTTGLFYDVTTGKENGWAVFRWTWRDNVFKRANIQQVHDKLVADNPDIVRTPLYRQEWLGEWVVDLSALVYKFDPQRNTVAELPKDRASYTYLLGLDLGFSDPSALMVGAYHPNDPVLYLVHARKQAGLIISDVAELVKNLWYCPSLKLRGPYPFAAMVADASALQGVEEMRQKHHLPLEAAQKSGKHGVIEVFNSDLLTGRIKVLPQAMEVADEWASLVWDERKLAALPKKWEEDPRFPNHLADASLYLWRKARNYDWQPAPYEAPMPGTQAWEEQRHERDMARIDRVRREGPVLVDELPAWLREVE